MTQENLQKLAAIFDDKTLMLGEDCRKLIDEFLDLLESGTLRCAYRQNDVWTVDERVKKGILLAFRIGQKEKVSVGPLTFIDKDTLWPRRFDVGDEIRIVPGSATIRRGSFLGRNVTVMPPSYVNVGAYVDEGSLIDSNALVGSCAQVGKRVHIAAGAQVGGVLEPIGNLPVIIEDDVLVGGNAGIFEGCHIKEGAVIGASTTLTKSSKVFDLVHEEIIEAVDGVLVIPKNAVVVPGARALFCDFAKENQLSIVTPLIVKYRDKDTDKKTQIEALLR